MKLKLLSLLFCMVFILSPNMAFAQETNNDYEIIILEDGTVVEVSTVLVKDVPNLTRAKGDQKYFVKNARFPGQSRDFQVPQSMSFREVYNGEIYEGTLQLLSKSWEKDTYSNSYLWVCRYDGYLVSTGMY